MALFLTADQGFFWLAAMLAVLCCALSGSFRRGAAGGGGGTPALFLHEKAGPWLRYGLAAAGCILLGFGRMKLEIRERVLEEQAAAERGEEPLVIEGQVEEIGETDYGYRLMVSGCEENGPEARRIPRRMYCYTDRADGLKIGMRIRAEGTMEAPEPERNPGGFDHRSFCRAKGIGGIFRADWAAPAGPGYSRFREGIRQIRLRLEGRLDQLTSGTDGGILKAVLLGDRSDMDQALYELYRKNGISHVLAISGLHVSILGLGLWKALRRCGFGFAAAGGAAGAFRFCYGLMTGFGPSVVRAAAMCGISFLAAFLGRTYDLMSALCIPALALLWSWPCLLTQASFQLSFLAAGAVAFPGSFLIRRFKARGLFQTLLVSASIQAATAPAVLYHSFELPVYGILLNLLVIP
ncbi:MAG: ComEC/Rec2 family competence protein [Alitiscatomonas sp.]